MADIFHMPGPNVTVKMSVVTPFGQPQWFLLKSLEEAKTFMESISIKEKSIFKPNFHLTFIHVYSSCSRETK